MTSKELELLRAAAQCIGPEKWEPHVNRAGVMEVRNVEGNGEHHSNWVSVQSPVHVVYAAAANPAMILALLDRLAELGKIKEDSDRCRAAIIEVRDFLGMILPACEADLLPVVRFLLMTNQNLRASLRVADGRIAAAESAKLQA